MASLLKKTFAVVLAIGMVFTCLTVNAATEAPAINISTAYVNIADITDSSADVTLEVHTRNFDNIYGAQFTVQLPDGLELVSGSVTTKSGLAWTENSNYVVNGNDIKFLDVRTTKGFDVKFDVTVPKASGVSEDYMVAITDSTFIDENEAIIDNVSVGYGEVIIQATESQPITGTTDGYFIPYGSVTSGDGFAEKNENGDFINGGTVVSSFKLPAAEVGVTTFGVSEKAADTNIDAGVQFGSYVIDVEDGKSYGTLVSMGNFADFKAAFIGKYGSEKAFYDRIVELCRHYLTGDNAGKTLKLSYGAGDDEYVKVACVDQSKHMWKSETMGHLQYALRVTNPTVGRQYSAIGYCNNGTSYTYSEEVQSYTYTGAAQ